MTEEEWSNSDDMKQMLAYMTGRASSRKFRLFACACCRRIWHLLDKRGHSAVSVAERLADRLSPEDEVEEARRDMITCRNEGALIPGRAAKYGWAAGAAQAVLFDTPVWHPNAPEQAAFGTTWMAAEAAWRHDGSGSPAIETRHQFLLLREVFENPYRPGRIDPDRVTPAVVSLAQEIYEARSFHRFALLADALLDAGCDDEKLIEHLRSKGPHVLGCWALDLILGKE